MKRGPPYGVPWRTMAYHCFPGGLTGARGRGCAAEAAEALGGERLQVLFVPCRRLHAFAWSVCSSHCDMRGRHWKTKEFRSPATFVPPEKWLGLSSLCKHRIPMRLVSPCSLVAYVPRAILRSSHPALAPEFSLFSAPMKLTQSVWFRAFRASCTN